MLAAGVPQSTRLLLSWKVTLAPRADVTSLRVNITGTVTHGFAEEMQSPLAFAATVFAPYWLHAPPGAGAFSHGQKTTLPSTGSPAPGLPGAAGPEMAPHQLQLASSAATAWLARPKARLPEMLFWWTTVPAAETGSKATPTKFPVMPFPVTLSFSELARFGCAPNAIP